MVGDFDCPSIAWCRCSTRRLKRGVAEWRRSGGAEFRGGWGEEGAELVVIEMESDEVAVVIVGASIAVHRRLGLICV